MEVYDSSHGFERSECVAIPLEQEEDRTNSSTPHVPTGFLCPSNLGALLESTTVSLVAGGWKDTSGTKEVITNFKSELQEDREPETGNVNVHCSNTSKENFFQDGYTYEK